MANTYTLIASTTVGAGGASSIDFTSIPSTYTDLVIKLSGRSNRSSTDDDIGIKFNSSSTGYSARNVYGTGSSANSLSSTAYGRCGNIDAATSTSNTFSNIEIYIPSYGSSNNKSYSSDSVEENNATGANQELWAGLWSNSSAITSISFFINSGNSFVQYSIAYLYGIKSS